MTSMYAIDPLPHHQLLNDKMHQSSTFYYKIQPSFLYKLIAPKKNTKNTEIYNCDLIHLFS